MFLGKGIAIDDVRLFDPVQDHVHRADAQHRWVEIEPVKHCCVEMLAQLWVAQHLGMLPPHIFAGSDEEAASAGRRIADGVRRFRFGELDHQSDNVPRRAELPVLPGRRNFAEHVLVDIAFRIAIVHLDFVELLDGLGQQRRRRNTEPRILHVLAEGRSLPAKRAQKRKDVLVDDLEHLARLEDL